MPQENSSTNVDFADRLQHLLKSDGISKSQLAEKVGVSPTAIGNYCTGRIPKADELLRIARTFNVSMEWLLTGESRRYETGHIDSGNVVREDEVPYRFTPKPADPPGENMGEAFSLMRQALEKLEEIVRKGPEP